MDARAHHGHAACAIPPPARRGAEGEPGDKKRALTVRELLAKCTASQPHVLRVPCGVMDPLGFALENFDATGKWRAHRPLCARHGHRFIMECCRMAGTCATPDELRAALVADPDQFVQNDHAERLLTYALGRVRSKYYDMPAVRDIVRAVRRDDYRFSNRWSLNIVLSDDAFMQGRVVPEAKRRVPPGRWHSAQTE
jgi:hypothetical protein